ncbi:MAG: NAD(P)H-dependent glycerol-3-phosphate dehydrogenase [Lachnospiraceae bacterium]|nr:NAD(P)H-dependent glycerol-3-phosphate dehydrogenase [Lachnospiraceae bacterium]
MRISFLGAGSWGTALAVTVAKNGHDVFLWSAVESEIKLLTTKREHTERLPGVKLPDNITIEADIKNACTDMDLIVFSVASPYVRSVAKQAEPYIPNNQVIVNVAKGIEDETYLTLSEILNEVLPGRNISVLSGPSHAEEVVKGIPTTVVVGSTTKETARYIQDIFMNDSFRVYISPDIIGIELGGAIKNVIALAAGIVDGLGLGDNTKAALMTRGLAEISRLGVAMGGKLETFSGLSGVGDLIVTCTSTHSRNHNAGYLMGQGKTADEAMKEVKQVVEGVYSAKAAYGLAKKYNVDMPIVEHINGVLFENKSVEDSLKSLFERQRKKEYSDLEW